MIDETVLTNLLREHGERVPVSAGGADAVLAALPRPARRDVRRVAGPAARTLATVLAIAVVIGVFAALIHSGNSTSDKARSGAARAVTAPAARETAGTAGTGGGLPSSRNDAIETTNGQSASATTVPGAAAKSSSGPGSSVTPTDTARVVRTGSLDLDIKRHEFGPTVSRITTIATGEGGYIADSQTNESAAVPSGTITLRVPTARFDATLAALRKLGTVANATARGVDVTGQYTDLQARIHAASATRDQLFTVLAKANTIGDILAVQDRIGVVQTQIEQMQGELQLLDAQTTYGKIAVSVSEPGPKPAPVVKPKHKSGLADAWDRARNGFTRRVEGLIAHSGSALVVLLCLAVIAGLLRLAVPRLRRLLV